jgi:hypothetical protein
MGDPCWCNGSLVRKPVLENSLEVFTGIKPSTYFTSYYTLHGKRDISRLQVTDALRAIRSLVLVAWRLGLIWYG